MTQKGRPARSWAANRGPSRATGNAAIYVHDTPKPGGGQFLWFDGKRVASVDPDGVLRRTLHSSRHLYRGAGEESWAFHVPVILAAQKLGAQRIEVRDADSGALYRAEVGDFLAHGRRFANEWGEQIALPLRHWAVLCPGALVAEQLPLPMEVGA